MKVEAIAEALMRNTVEMKGAEAMAPKKDFPKVKVLEITLHEIVTVQKSLEYLLQAAKSNRVSISHLEFTILKIGGLRASKKGSLLVHKKLARLWLTLPCNVNV